MTDSEGRGAGPAGGEAWSVDLLADLHAGALDEPTSTRLWQRVETDPQARAVIDALESTRAALADTPAPAVPGDVAARIDATIEAEHRQREQAPAPHQSAPRQQAPASHHPAAPAEAGQAPPSADVVDLTAARRRRNRRLARLSGAVAAAAAVVAIVAVGVTNFGSNTEQGTPIAEPTGKPNTAGNPLAVRRGDLGRKGFSAALGARDYGPLEGKQRLAGCLAANKAGEASSVAGVKQLRLDGKPGVLILLTTGKPAQYRLLVVSPECAQGNPATMSNSLIGGASTSPPPTS